MNDSVSSNKRIAKNTIFLYFRMLFLMAIGFFTTRKILEALGVVDLGIYDVVGTMILIFDFVSSGLSNATQRYINIALGENDISKTRQYFSQSLFIHIAFAIIIVLFVETFGIWLVENKLIIPKERLDAAIIITHISAVSIIFKMIKVCYDSDIIARERMSIYAYFSIIEGIGKLLICYIIIYNESVDKLVLYGILLLIINAIVTLSSIIYCTYNFKETHVKFYTDKSVYKQLLSFISITSFGVLSWALGKQGMNIVINLFFGTAVNGAKALAGQLDRIITQFTNNIDTAIRPQVIKLYAQKQVDEMIKLSHSSCKLMFYVALILSVPLLFQTEEILSIWLKRVPIFTVVFTQIMVFETLGRILGIPYNNISLATGKIKNIQLYGRLITLSGLPISYILLLYYKNEYLPTIVMTILTFAYTFYMVYDTNKNMKFGIKNYIGIVIYPIFKVLSIVLIGCYVLDNMIHISTPIISFISVSFILCIYALLVIYIWGLDSNEKNTCKKFIFRKLLTNNLHKEK